MPPLLVPPPASSPSSTPDGDALLGRLLDHVAALGLSLYPAQEEAIFEILAGKHVVLATPTGSGKSLVATAFLFKALAEGKRGFWSCPVKALVNEKFFALCETFGADKVGLVTGDASVNRDAPLLCGTAEILSNMIVRSDGANGTSGAQGGNGAERVPIDYVVMDEFHYYGDRERGVAWQIPLIAMPHATFLLMSATLGETRTIERQLEATTGREVAHVRGVVRPVPLELEYKESALHETIAELVREGRAPIYLVNFTQRAAAEEAQNLLSVDFLAKADKDAIKQALHETGERFDSPYGKELARFVRHGVGLHHAGLLPRYRRLVERLAARGLLRVVSGTDTLGVGINIPIRTVVLTQLCKFDGEKDAILSVREFHQITGRAGRKGFDDRGYVVVQAPAHVVENKKLAASGKKFTRRQPPKKGFVHWDKNTFERLANGTPEPLESRFTISHGLLLALLQSQETNVTLGRGGGYRKLLDLIARCHDSDHRKHHHRRQAAQQFRTLRRAGLVDVVLDERSRAPRPVPSPELQHDFSLHHTLSLYLVDTLPKLDPTLPTHAFDALSLVEAILENPRPVLMAQLDQMKTERMAELKAGGVEFEDRIRELDAMEWPKPNRDFIYDTFNDFSDRHPWVAHETIAPKSVARELLERFCGFHEYVRDLGIARSEGVLLRYLSQVWRALTQNVPSQLRTTEIEERALDLAAVLRTVDASLLDEWRALRNPSDAPAVAPHGAPAGAVTPHDARAELARDPRALAARTRAELHRLLGALARKDYGEAAAALAPARADDEPWTPLRLEAEMAPFWAAHKAISVTPAARSPRHTLMKKIDERVWDVVQTIVERDDPDAGWQGTTTVHLRGPASASPEGGDENDDSDGDGNRRGSAATAPMTAGWAIHARIDLRPAAPAQTDSEAPLIELVRVGL